MTKVIFEKPIDSCYVTKEFESKYYLNLKKWSDWFIYGFLGVLIFGILFVILRKKIFGF